MPADYKYIDHEEKRSGGGPKRLSALLLLLFVICILVYAAFFFTTRKIDSLILSGNYESAEQTLSHWKWLPLVRGRVYEKLGTSRLLARDYPAAALLLNTASQKSFFRPVSFWPEVLRKLWSTGRYSDGLGYADHIEKRIDEKGIIHFYKAGFLAGENRLSEAASELKASGNLPELAGEASLLKAEIDQRSTTGQYAYLFDREKLPLVNMNQKGEPVILAETLRGVLESQRPNLIERIRAKNSNPVMLSIDYRIQNAAIKALGKYAGAIVLVDARTGDLLAVASNLKGVGSSYEPATPLALSGEYEPGSIIKMITLAGALQNHVDFNHIFPVHCEGHLKLDDNKILYDWMKHGEVKNIDQAAAVSCNVAFAKIGLAMKPADLIANLKQFGFNSKLNDPLPLQLGTILDSDVNEEYLAKLSIGLDYLKMTPLHAALIASSIANGGSAENPRFVLNYRNIIGIPFLQQPVVEYRRFLDPKTAEVLTRVMREVVTDPEGTGRRAAITNFPFAMKTGTAGDAAKGYNAILIGFGPLPKPKIAFSVFLDHAGKAEFEGARVVKLFLESIQAYI
jgi:hypothetical protein